MIQRDSMFKLGIAMIKRGIDTIEYFCFCAFCRNKVHVIDRKKTSEIISSGKLSVARFGDGELVMMLKGRDIGFQNSNDELIERLKAVALNQDSLPIMICMPDVFTGMCNVKKAPKRHWKNWIAHYGMKLLPYLNEKTEYGDSFVTRLYFSWKSCEDEQEIVANIQKSWNHKRVTIVEGKQTRWGVGNDLLDHAAHVSRILCPPENAWSAYDEILRACISVKNDTDLFILALGPTATVLAYDLTREGCVALDLGHMDLQYEYFLNKATERIKIPGKYNNEIDGGNVVEACGDEKYIQSICKVID